MKTPESFSDFLFQTADENFQKPWAAAWQFAQAYPSPSWHSLEDVEGYVRGMGIEVEYVNTLPLSTHGFATVVDDQPCLVVNRRDHPDRQALTILHELKHLVFDFRVIPVLFNLDEIGLTPGPQTPRGAHIQEEVFACTLLMAHGSHDFTHRVLNMHVNPEPGVILLGSGIFLGIGLLIEGFHWIKTRLFPNPPVAKQVG